ncbi:hypothetical protein Ade02nite_46010 [Paractinoplanes deccanensis]|uniref:Alpha-amylase n=1 Tax=Paractinoplanes deccanensis TaxID=113561 RepID=A0ABQ3Y7X3_9ACTN|nr:hypothetical protein [Actinoplanes deccanensis]GID75960.1 hypothetical protein Ade02nite_46010 [Actinoplanes deccanensis]
MRKSQPKTGNRPLRAGIATAATAALVVAGAAGPAYAVAVDGTLSTNAAPLGGGVTVTLTATGAFTGLVPGTVGGRFIAGSATCDLLYGTTTTAKPAATVTIANANEATIAVPSLAAGTWKACVFGATTGTTLSSSTPLVATSGVDTLTVSGANTVPTLSPAAGPAAGGTSVTATRGGNYLSTGGSTLGVVFRSTGACAGTYTTTGAAATTTATKNAANTVATFTVPATLPSAGAYTVCIYAGTAGTSNLLGNATYSALPTSTVSPTSGNSGGGNTIIVTTATSTMAAGTTPGGLFTESTSCPATFDVAGVDDQAATVTRISGVKAAVAVPAGVLHTGDEETTAWRFCLYANAVDGALIAVPSTYSVAEELDVSTVTITPNGGPAQGNSTITVQIVGGLPPVGGTVSASLGGSPLEDITILGDDSFSATTTAHAAGATRLSVTTAAGTQTSTTDDYTYSYGITTTPNTATFDDTAVTLDILGSGFDSLTFAASAEAGASTAPGDGVGVFLVANGWFSAMDTANSVIATGLVSQCMDVTKISDNEMICTLDLTKKSSDSTGYYNTGSVPRGVYNVAVVEDSNAAAMAIDDNVSRISSGSIFTVSDY